FALGTALRAHRTTLRVARLGADSPSGRPFGLMARTAIRVERHSSSSFGGGGLPSYTRYWRRWRYERRMNVYGSRAAWLSTFSVCNAEARRSTKFSDQRM